MNTSAANPGRRERRMACFQRGADGDGAIHMLFANYLCMKIEEGYFPAGCRLPKAVDFMAAFKLGLPEILKAWTMLEKLGILKLGNDGIAEVVMGPEGSPFPLDARKDVDELFGLFLYLELEVLRKAWVKIDLVKMSRNLLSAQKLATRERALFMDNAVHLELMRTCGNPTLASAQKQIFKQIEFFRHMHMEILDEKDMKTHVGKLESILDSILVRDLHGVCRKLTELVFQRRDDLLKQLENPSVLTAQN